MKHIREWFREYLLALLTAFPLIWLESADVRALLPPEWVSRIAPFVGAALLVQRIRARMAQRPDPTDQAGA